MGTWIFHGNLHFEMKHIFDTFLCLQLNLIARQRDEQKRANFRRQIIRFKPHQFLFIDESAKDERTFQVFSISHNLYSIKFTFDHIHDFIYFSIKKQQY